MAPDVQADGVRAQQILDDDLMQRMLAQAEAGIVDSLATLKVGQMTDHTLLITLVTQLQAVREIPSLLRDAVAAKAEAERTPPAVA